LENNIDGRFIILIIALALLMLAIVKQTLNVWLENQDHRKARAWDNDKCNQNFMDWLALKVASNLFFKKVMVAGLIPFVVLFLFIRYPHLVLKRAYYHFEKQVNIALDSLRR
jgi:hypothetical protein